MTWTLVITIIFLYLCGVVVFLTDTFCSGRKYTIARNARGYTYLLADDYEPAGILPVLWDIMVVLLWPLTTVVHVLWALGSLFVRLLVKVVDYL